MHILVRVPGSRAVLSHRYALTAGHPALCPEAVPAPTASACVEGSLQDASCCPLVMVGSVYVGAGMVMEGKGRKCPPICPVTGHPLRMGTRLPTAPGRNKLLNSYRDKKCYLFPALSVGRWGLSGQPPPASTSSCEEAV